MAPKATREQAILRVQELVRIKLEGAQFWDIEEYVREKASDPASPWYRPGSEPYGHSTLYKYIERADDAIEAACQKDRGKLMARHLAQRQFLYAMSLKQGDVRAALSCADSEAKLLGLHDEEILRRLAKIEEKVDEQHAVGDGANADQGGRGESQQPDRPALPHDPLPE